MKKLMMATAVTLVAIASQAASFNWQTSGSSNQNYIYFGSSKVQSTTLGATVIGSAYLFDSAALAQSQLLSNLRGADDAAAYWNTMGTSTAGYVDKATVASSKITLTPTRDYGEVGVYNLYYAVLIKDASGNTQVLISDTTPAERQASATTPVSFTGNKTLGGNVNAGTGTAFTGNGGWYTVATIPEPTSGLLLLLGVAGLALKRKRA